MAQIKWDQKITAYVFFPKIGVVVVHAKGTDFASLFAFSPRDQCLCVKYGAGTRRQLS